MSLQDQQRTIESEQLRVSDSGVFSISLDFELFWGVRDKRQIQDYGSHLEGVWEAIPRMLERFEDRDIHATWATVGMLFFDDTQALKASLPSIKPAYSDSNFSPYNYIASQAKLTHEHHFAPQLIDLITATKGQAVGSHTFSHFYTLEAGQSVDAFRHDMIMAVDVARRAGLNTDTLVFPRNQFEPEYLAVLNELGIRAFRGNPACSIYSARAEKKLTLWRRGLRFLDAYVNIGGYHLIDIRQVAATRPYNFAGSFFLRPYSAKLRWLDGLKIRRLMAAMTEAAKQKKVFHLWWHPHNFGHDLENNLAMLEQLLDHYVELKERYSMTSLNMEEMADCCDSLRGKEEYGTGRPSRSIQSGAFGIDGI